MSGTHAPAARCEVEARDHPGVEAHLVDLTERHDPMAHRRGIEALVRSARAEFRLAYRAFAREGRGS